MPTTKTESQLIAMADLITNAETVFDSDLYSNHVQVTITSNELFIDFFYTSPQVARTPSVKVQHVARMVAPIAIAKGLATALANVVANHEAENNAVLPNSRTPDQNDKITIWP